MEIIIESCFPLLSRPASSLNLQIDNFSVLPGSEIKLLKGLELGCSGIITATCNVTASLARKVYDDFFAKKQQTHNEKPVSYTHLTLPTILLV